MSTYCRRYVPIPNYQPTVNNDWNTVTPSVYAPHIQRIPFIVMKPPAIPQLYPCVNSNVRKYTLPELTQPLSVSNYCEPGPSYSSEFHRNANEQDIHQVTTNTLIRADTKNTDDVGNGDDTFIGLPSELFPSAMAFPIDPNPIIDEFCKQPNIEDHAAWIMDLELGIPRAPTSRLIPAYNVKYNSIQCKNSPSAIHPGFEICIESFKKALLFYYDCIISTWYRGYVVMNNDLSVENFQEWLMQPLQRYGMSWPKNTRLL